MKMKMRKSRAKQKSEKRKKRRPSVSPSPKTQHRKCSGVLLLVQSCERRVYVKLVMRVVVGLVGCCCCLGGRQKGGASSLSFRRRVRVRMYVGVCRCVYGGLRVKWWVSQDRSPGMLLSLALRPTLLFLLSSADAWPPRELCLCWPLSSASRSEMLLLPADPRCGSR